MIITLECPRCNGTGECHTETPAKARYRKWLDISDTDSSLTFAKFQRQSKVRTA